MSLRLLATPRFHYDRRVFLCVYVLLGLPYLVLTGPFRAADERNHFFRSYEISELRFNPFRLADGTVGDNLPASLSRLSDALGIHNVQRIEASQILAARNLQLEPQQRDFVEFSTAIYSPLAYVPSAISIAAGRLFGAGPLALLYFARSANLLVGSWLIAWALSYAGYARPAAALVALFPMTVSQVATMTADAMSFGLAFFWIALVIDTAVSNRGEVTLKRKIALALLALALSQLRPPYPFLVLLIFLVPIRKFGRMGAAVCCLVITASLLPAWGWNRVAARVYEKPQLVGQRVDPQEQLAWVGQHPGIFWHRVKQDVGTHGVDYWAQLVGRLGWLNIPLPTWLYAGFAVGFVVLTFFGRKKPPWPLLWQRAVLGGVVLLGVIAIELALYATFNPVKSPFILGVQGRYFTVLLFVLAFAGSYSWLDRPGWNRIAMAACGLFVAAAHVSAWFALARAAGKI
jgi:uncharacterized membrane protein